MKLTPESLALLDLPREHACTLPGYGWRPPDEGLIKINTDGSILMEARRGGVGGVVRSNSFMASWCKPYPGITDPLVNEGLAVWDGVIFAKIRGYKKIGVETDCMDTVNLWNSRLDTRTLVAPILSEIGELTLSFSFFAIQHVMQSANMSDHLRAKASTLRSRIAG